jgi:Rne/Rng family ribonuclease
MPLPRRARQRLLVAVRDDHRWAAWLEEGRVVEFHYERDGEVSPVGNIYLGRVTHVEKGLGAAFVDIGMSEAAFLPLSDAGMPVVEGAKIVVQVEREGRAGKGPRVTARVSLASVYLILLPGRRGVSISERIVDQDERSRLSDLVKTIAEVGEGFMVRTAASGTQERNLREEATALRASWQELLGRQHVRPPIVLYRQPPIDIRLLRDHGWRFDDVTYDQRNAAAAATTWLGSASPRLAARIGFRRGAEWDPPAGEVLVQVEDALQPRIDLPAGGGLVIEPTEAMTVIDVNALSASNAQGDAANERVLLRTNLAAAAEIARQIRLRNIGGIVVIDFIDLKEGARRREVVDCLRASTADDSAPVWVGAMSRLGLVELTRRRRGPTLGDLMTKPCPTCDGMGHMRQLMDIM